MWNCIILHFSNKGVVWFVNRGNLLLINQCDITLTLKEPGGRNPPPLDIFCYISAGCYFFALKLLDFFSSSLALELRPFL